MSGTALQIESPGRSWIDATLRTAGIYRLARRRLCEFLAPIVLGKLTVVFPDDSVQRFGSGEGRRATLAIRSPRFYTRLALSGDLGFAESYVAGEWETPDLAELLLLLVDNRSELGDLEVESSRLRTRLSTFLHRRRANTRRGARRNIADHYDLGNDLFAAFLDRGMTYSCALYEHPDEPLEVAQDRKLDRILDLVGARAGDHLLEIGCGWGSLAERAALERGCRVTCLTLSERQKRWAEERFARAGVSDRVEVRLQDYRDASGTFDGIVSIEMLEAVGEANLTTYFERCARLLAPGARAAVQVITIHDDLYDDYRRRADFIQTHIFPGGHLPSPGALREVVGAVPGLALERMESIGASYAPTLAEWRRRFLAAAGRIRRQGYPAEFLRKWVYYFSYCEAGFRGGALDDLHLLLRRESGVGSRVG